MRKDTNHYLINHVVFLAIIDLVYWSGVCSVVKYKQIELDAV